MPNKYLDSVGLAEYTGLIKRDLAPKASPALTGTPTAPTPTAGDDSTKIATTEFVNDAIDTEITSEIAAEVTRADGKYLPFAGGTLTGVVNGVTPTAGDDSTKLATTEYVQDEIRSHANMPIGHEYFTMNPNIPQGSLPLFGGEYSRETYADLWAWVQQQTGYFITDSAWQAMANSQNGNVPFYSDGDGSTTFRVPSLKCWIKGANGTVSEVGSYLAAGLPNITGGAYTDPAGSSACPTKGYYGAITKFGNTAIRTFTFSGTVTSDYGIKLDASLSNSIYGKSATVQPPSIVGMWLVKAYGVVEETGSIDEQAYIDDRFNASKQYTDDQLVAAKDYTDTEVSTGVPTGVVQAFAGSNTPTGWLLCDGSAVSRTTYAALFSAIGTKYGSGNGSSTFNLPNLTDKFIQGNTTSGTVKSAGLPNISGNIHAFSGQAICSSTNSPNGAFFARAAGAVYKKSNTTGTDTATATLGFDASLSNSIYGNSTTVQPPSVTMRYIIKY